MVVRLECFKKVSKILICMGRKLLHRAVAYPRATLLVLQVWYIDPYYHHPLFRFAFTSI